MIKRIVEISNPAYLRLKNNQLVVEQDGIVSGSVPIEDLGVLILDHQGIACTHGLLSACAENNVITIFTDNRHLPSAITIPIDGHHLQTKIIAKQIEASEPTRKRLWQSIIKAKVKEQSKVLKHFNLEYQTLQGYVERVKSGDPDNIEAQAARLYWQTLFGYRFRRDPDSTGINALLNYGYAIIRASVARAVIGAGLLPSLGVKHRNQYNTFCLADDLMEPLRPAVDRCVYDLTDGTDSEDIILDRDTKLALLSLLTNNCTVGDREVPVMVALHQYTASVREFLTEDAKNLNIPQL